MLFIPVRLRHDPTTMQKKLAEADASPLFLCRCISVATAPPRSTPPGIYETCLRQASCTTRAKECLSEVYEHPHATSIHQTRYRHGASCSRVWRFSSDHLQIYPRPFIGVAARLCHVELLRLLLHYGADPNDSGGKGHYQQYSPLHYLLQVDLQSVPPERFITALQVLLLAGADPRKQDAEGNLPALSLIDPLFRDTEDDGDLARFSGRILLTLIDQGCDFDEIFSAGLCGGKELRIKVLQQLQKLFPEVCVDELILSPMLRKCYSFIQSSK